MRPGQFPADTHTETLVKVVVRRPDGPLRYLDPAGTMRFRSMRDAEYHISCCAKMGLDVRVYLGQMVWTREETEH